MSAELDEWGRAVYDSTWRTLAPLWPEAAPEAENLIRWTAGALEHLSGTVRGFTALSAARFDCRAGCAFCCSLGIDVRAHEVFLILDELHRTADTHALGTLKARAALRQASCGAAPGNPVPAPSPASSRASGAAPSGETACREGLEAGSSSTGHHTVHGSSGASGFSGQPCLLLQDGRCRIYAARPAACRRYFSQSAAACAALVDGPAPPPAPAPEFCVPETSDPGLQHPMVAEMGRYAAAAVHNVFVARGYDGFSYDLGRALAECFQDETGECRRRWLAREKAFSAAAESATPAGFSQTEALTRLKQSLEASGSRNISRALIVLTGILSFLLASPAARHASAAGGIPEIAVQDKSRGLSGRQKSPSKPAPSSGRLRAERVSPEEQPVKAHALSGAEAFRPVTTSGDCVRTVICGRLRRRCLVHVPPDLDLSKPSPLVLLLHGAAMNGRMMAGFSGMNAQADQSGFIAAYPEGTGAAGALLTWNSGGIGPRRAEPDDVECLRLMLDDLEAALNIDSRRVYAVGLSNGGMMVYRLAAALPERLAAIASVGGTLAQEVPDLRRAVPLIHFHGTEDRIVPWAGPDHPHPARLHFLSVPASIAAWTRLAGCPAAPVIRKIPDRFEDGTTVEISTWGPGRNQAEVVLVKITGGGHTWPGRQPALSLLGRSTREIHANAMIWDFLRRFSLPEGK